MSEQLSLRKLRKQKRDLSTYISLIQVVNFLISQFLILTIHKLIIKKMNEALIDSITHLQSPKIAAAESGYIHDILCYLRYFFYLLVVIKVFQLAFLRKRKRSLKQRIYRKFAFAHKEIMKQFNEEDRVQMESTLSNTLKNASNIYKPPKEPRQSILKKKVSFFLQKNNYYTCSNSPLHDLEKQYSQVQKSTSIKRNQSDLVKETMVNEVNTDNLDSELSSLPLDSELSLENKTQKDSFIDNRRKKNN